MCTNCNQTSNTPCGCNNGVYQEVNICNQCPPEVPCTCPIKDLSTDCVLYNQDDIVCGATVVVPKNTILSVALQQIVFWACTKFEELKNFFRIINIGVGAEIYAGDNLLGEKKLRKINSSTPLITVVQNTNDISIGVDVNGLSALQKTYSVANIGTGEDVYKVPDTVVGNNTQFNLKRISSSSLNVVTSLDGNTITIDTLDSGIRRFIVNSDYTGLIEEGTVSRPFKNLQNALNAYVGIGTNILPENSGVVIDIQKDTNVFVGNLAYQNLNLIVRGGATIVSNPAFGNHLLDIDSDAILPLYMTPFDNVTPVSISIKTEETGLIYLNKEGFKNRGTTFNSGLSRGKQVSIQGKIAISPDISVALPSTRKIIDINSDNQIGFYNDNNVAHFIIEKSVLQADTSKIFYCGAKGILYVSNSTISIGNGVTPFNVNTIPFTFNNGKVVEQNNSTKVIGIIGNIYNIVYGYYNNSTHIDNGSITGGTCNYIFANMDSTNTTLDIKKTIFDIVTITAINLSPFILWTNLFFKDNYFYLGIFNYTQSTIQPNATNSINGQIVETLNKYDNRAAAVVAGLFSGCKFINTGGVVSPTTGWFVDIVI